MNLNLIKSALLSLTLAFNATSPFAAIPPAQPEGLWKLEQIDAVVKIETCPQSLNACAAIYWLNPHDTKLVQMFGDHSRQNPQELCGFSPKLDFHAVATRHWQGTMELRGMGMTVDVDVTMLNDNEMKVDTSKFIFSQEDTWKRVTPQDKNFPPCKKP